MNFDAKRELEMAQQGVVPTSDQYATALERVVCLEGEIARLRAENVRLWIRLDRTDCEKREGSGTYHCPIDDKCDACVMRRDIDSLESRLAEEQHQWAVQNEESNVLHRALKNSCVDGIQMAARIELAGKEIEGERDGRAKS